MRIQRDNYHKMEYLVAIIVSRHFHHQPIVNIRLLLWMSPRLVAISTFQLVGFKTYFPNSIFSKQKGKVGFSVCLKILNSCSLSFLYFPTCQHLLHTDERQSLQAETVAYGWCLSFEENVLLLRISPQLSALFHSHTFWFCRITF